MKWNRTLQQCTGTASLPAWPCRTVSGISQGETFQVGVASDRISSPRTKVLILTSSTFPLHPIDSPRAVIPAGADIRPIRIVDIDPPCDMDHSVTKQEMASSLAPASSSSSSNGNGNGASNNDNNSNNSSGVRSRRKGARTQVLHGVACLPCQRRKTRVCHPPST